MLTQSSYSIQPELKLQMFNWLITKAMPQDILAALQEPGIARFLTKDHVAKITKRCKVQDDTLANRQTAMSIYLVLLQIFPDNQPLRLNAIIALLKHNRDEEAAQLFASYDVSKIDTLPKRVQVMRLLVQAGHNKRAMALAQKIVLLLEQADNDVRQQYAQSVENTYYQAKLSWNVAELVTSVPNPAAEAIQGYVLIYDVSNKVTSGLMGPIAVSLKRNRYAVAAVTAHTIPRVKTGIPEFDQLSGLIANDGNRLTAESGDDTLYCEWMIDWPNKMIQADGVNFFPYFHERISQKLRCYSADITSNAKAAGIFEQLLRQSDTALAFCKRILPLAEQGKPIRIVLMDSHFAPMGIIREWCAQVGKRHNIHCIALSSAYENYYTNLTTRVATTISVEDLTAQPTLRHPLMGGYWRFEQFLQENPGIQADDPEVLGWICMNRSQVSSKMSLQRQHVGQCIEEAKRAGHQVFALLGKVLIDFAAPYDKGLVYADFQEWVLAIIQLVRDTQNVLIIKPHPHELRTEIVVNGVQMLRDLLPRVLPDNVIFLEHDAFNSYELAEFVDATFAWNGTALAEFSALGYPSIPGSRWAIHDYPIGLPELQTHDDYKAVLQGNRRILVSDAMRQRAAAFLKFLKSDKVAIPYRYLKRACANQGVGLPEYYPEEIAQFLSAGDPYVDCVAERMFEFT